MKEINYGDDFGFSDDDIEMFEDAWMKISNTTPEPTNKNVDVKALKQRIKQLSKTRAQNAQIPNKRYKHLIGQHNQLDHAWNRGLGGGTTIDGETYQGAVKLLDTQVANGEITQEMADLTRANLKKKFNERYDLISSLSLGMSHTTRRNRTLNKLEKIRGNQLTDSADIAAAAQQGQLANRGPQSLLTGLTQRVSGFIDRLRNPKAPRENPQTVKYKKDTQQAFEGLTYEQTMNLIREIKDNEEHPLYPKNFDELAALVEHYKPQSFPTREENPEYYKLPGWYETYAAKSGIEQINLLLQRKNNEETPRFLNINGNVISNVTIDKLLEDPASIEKYGTWSNGDDLAVVPFSVDMIADAIRRNENPTNDVVVIGGKKYFNSPNRLNAFEWSWMTDYFGEDVYFLLNNYDLRKEGPYHWARPGMGVKPTWFIDDKIPDTLVNFGRIDDFQLYNPDIIPEIVQNLLADNGKKLQSYISENHPAGSPVAETIANLMGLDIANPNHMDILASALSIAEIPGTNAEIKLSEYNGALISEVTSTNPDTGEKVYTKRRISVAPNGAIEIFNDGMQVKGIKNSGIGHAFLAKQVLAARKIGQQTGKTVDIKTDAASATPDLNRPQQNGMHLWPRVGYDVTIPTSIKKAFSDLGFEMDKVKKTSQLFKERNKQGILASEIWPSVVEKVMQEDGSVNGEGVIRATDITDAGLQALLSYSEQRTVQNTILSGLERPKTAAHARIQQLRESLDTEIKKDPRIGIILDTIESIISAPISENEDYNNYIDAVIKNITENNSLVNTNYNISPTLYPRIQPLVAYRGNHESPLPATKARPVEIVPAFKIADVEERLKIWKSFSEDHDIYNWSLDDSLITPQLVEAIQAQKENGKEILADIVEFLKIRENNQNVLKLIERNWGNINSVLDNISVDTEAGKIARQVLAETLTQFNLLQRKYNKQEHDEIEPEISRVAGYVTGVGVNITPEVTQFHDMTLGDSVNPNMQHAPYPIDVIADDDNVTDAELEQQKIVAQEISRFIEKYVDKRLHVQGMKLVATSSPEDASYADPNSLEPYPRARVGSAMSSIANTLHEFFHGIEEQNPEVKNLVNAFWVSRIANETVGMRQNGLEWIPDKFGDWYIGMPNGSFSEEKSSLEVLSMAASFFVTDPVKFAREQPDYYRFIATLLSGKWMDK